MTDQEKQKLTAETVNATVTQMLGAKDLQIAQLTGMIKVLQAENDGLRVQKAMADESPKAALTRAK